MSIKNFRISLLFLYKDFNSRPYNASMKDFDVWNEIKKQVESHPRFEFNEGELWWCDIGLNIGSEQDGPSPLFERLVLVGKKFSN